jgi:phosphoribosylglycinamide formyltransferase-1
VPFTLIAPLDERYDGDALAHAIARSARTGYALRRVERPDGQIAAWIDAHFPGSWWSSQANAGSAWIAERHGTIAGFAAFGVSDNGARFGPYGVGADHRGNGVGEDLLVVAMCALRATGATQAVIPEVSDERLVAMFERRTGAHVVETRDEPAARSRTVILASGAGTNARNVMELAALDALPLELVGLVSNDRAAGALDAARAHEVPARTVWWNRDVETREAYDERLLVSVERMAPDLILLLGWMHLLSPPFLECFEHTLNVHPAYLPLDPRADTVVMPDGSSIPALRGAHALRDAVQMGLAWTGASFHAVTNETDRGRIFVRIPLAIPDGADEARLREQIRPLEFAAVSSGISRWASERP